MDMCLFKYNIQKKNLWRLLKKQGIFLALLLVIAVFSITSPNFITVKNFLIIFRQCSIMGIMACAMTLVIVSGNFDLSVGSLLSFSTVLMIRLFNLVGPVPAILITIIVGIIFGSLSGLLVGYLKLNSMITTLGMMGIIQALTFFVSGGKNSILKHAENSWFLKIGRGDIFGIPNVAIICLSAVFIFEIILRRTVFGKYTQAVGGNQLASKFTGINDNKIVLTTFMLSGMMTAIAAIMLGSRIGSAQNAIGEGYEFDVITAVILGGTSLSGGSGSVIKTFIGVLIMGVLKNGFVMLGFPYSTQWLAQGLIILVVVWIDITTKKEKIRK